MYPPTHQPASHLSTINTFPSLHLFLSFIPASPSFTSKLSCPFIHLHIIPPFLPSTPFFQLFIICIRVIRCWAGIHSSIHPSTHPPSLSFTHYQSIIPWRYTFIKELSIHWSVCTSSHFSSFPFFDWLTQLSNHPSVHSPVFLLFLSFHPTSPIHLFTHLPCIHLSIPFLHVYSSSFHVISPPPTILSFPLPSFCFLDCPSQPPFLDTSCFPDLSTLGCSGAQSLVLFISCLHSLPWCSHPASWPQVASLCSYAPPICISALDLIPEL